MLQPLVLPVNGSRGFKQVKEKKYPNFLLKDPSSFECEGKYPGSDSTQWGLGFMECCPATFGRREPLHQPASARTESIAEHEEQKTDFFFF